MQVEVEAQMMGGDGGTLDVPAGSSAAKGAVPAGLPRPLLLPDEAVERVALAWSLRVATVLRGQAQHVGATQPREFPEGRVGSDREVHVPADLVDGTVGLQPLDEVDDDGDRLHGAGKDVGRYHRQSAHVLPKPLGLPLGEV